ncbi:hypothetical protein C9374_011357 [Naegleria lovaniensis]|uniref:Charged multivesicular body protein 7 n=1 Tax=Naegleria lovaniensis TaxID=51637 RepID=A0AA88KQT2_NAELO|nr:uncharacterized protein C9374_011357 [Naegleria lovaniensis]KAG2392632.1 hypothetical protein C9374_011357 [Naegleria lovaniensis]
MNAPPSHTTDIISDEEKNINLFLERKFPEWKDDKSMIFYMSNFKKTRQLNVNDWDSRFSFWRNILLSIISEYYKNTILIVTIRQLKQYMSRRKKSDEGIVETTLGWQTVIQEMIHQGELISIEEFKNVYDTNNNQGIGSWLIGVATTWFFGRTSALSNAAGANTALNNSKIPEDNKYIVMKPLKEITMNFIKNAHKNKVSDLDLYFAPSELREREFPNYDFTQIDLLLRYMHCEESAFVVEIANSKKGVVCFEESSMKKEVLNNIPHYTQKFIGIIQLKEMSHLLDKEVKSLQMKVDSLVSEAKKCLTFQRKEDAKWILKKKKLVSNILEKRNQARHNIFELLTSTENATSDIEVLKSLQVGATSLKQYTTELNTMNVEESIENIADTMSEYQEIKHIIDSGFDQINQIQGLQFDEEELSRELEKLAVEPSASAQIQKPSKVSSSASSSQESSTEVVFPTVDDIPTESFSVLEWEKQHTTNSEIKEFCALKLKMLTLKKKMNKLKGEELATKLQQKVAQFEKKQQEFKLNGNSKALKHVETYLSLLREEIESISTEQVEEKQPVLL